MLSAALRGTPASIGNQSCAIQPRMPPLMQQLQPSSRALASSYSSLADEPLFESPQAQALSMPQQFRRSVLLEGDLDVDGNSSSDEGDVFGATGDLEDGPSLSSSQTLHGHHLSLSTPSMACPMATSIATSTTATLPSGGPSGE